MLEALDERLRDPLAGYRRLIKEYSHAVCWRRFLLKKTAEPRMNTDKHRFK